MSIEENKKLEANREIARGYFEEAWIPNGNFEKYIGEGFVRHNHGRSDPGIQTLKNLCTFYHDSFSDWELAIHDIICERNKAVVHFTIMLTHSKQYNEYKPSGARIQVNGIDIFRITDGMIVEQWVEVDFHHFLNQIKEHSKAV